MRGSSTSPGDLETIARATDGLEISGALGISLDFLTYAPHIDVHGAWGHKAGIAPDGIEQVIAAEDAAWMPGKVIQQSKFGRGGGGELSPHLQLHGAGIDDHFLEADDGGRRRPFKTAQHSLDPGDQFPGGEGFGDVVVGAQFQAQDAIVFPRPGGEKDDRNGAESGIAAQTAAHIEAVSARNHDVQKEEHGRLALGVGDQVCRGAVDAYTKTCGFQMMLYQTGNIRIIFEDAYGLTQLDLPQLRAAQDTPT